MKIQIKKKKERYVYCDMIREEQEQEARSLQQDQITVILRLITTISN